MRTAARVGQSSELEALLDFQMQAAGLPAWETEFQFHPRRKWRADRGWPHLRLLVEVEGGIWTGGRKYGIIEMPRRSDTGRFAFLASAVVCDLLTTPVVSKAPPIRWTSRPAERLGNDGNLIGGALLCLPVNVKCVIIRSMHHRGTLPKGGVSTAP